MILLITGAGASRNLGQDDSPMPLMRDWSDALCEALDQREPGLAQACHLLAGMDGPTFEENLGLLLRWQQVRHLEHRFLGLGGEVVGHAHTRVETSRQRADDRLGGVMEAINTTLYEQFAQHRVDDVLAKAAYKSLLDKIGHPELVLATTNYDRVAESALAALGHEVDAGFQTRPQRSPKLEPVGLVAKREKKTPVIHLHGAVGWYEQAGTVIEHHPDLPYNPTLGTPVVLYPDPEKDPTSDAIVSELWLEFNAAVDLADAVLVIGHSLHDPALVRTLRRAAEEKPTVISYLEAGGEEQVMDRVPGAIPIELEFGPELEGGKVAHRVLKFFQEPRRLKTFEMNWRRSAEVKAAR